MVVGGKRGRSLRGGLYREGAHGPRAWPDDLEICGAGFDTLTILVLDGRRERREKDHRALRKVVNRFEGLDSGSNRYGST